MAELVVLRSEAMRLTVDFTVWTPDAVVKAHGEDPAKMHELLSSSGVFQARAWNYESKPLAGKRVVRLRLFAFSGQSVDTAQLPETLAKDGYALASPQMIEVFRRRYPAIAIQKPHSIVFLGGCWQRVQFKKHDVADGASQVGPYLVRETLGLRACGPYYGLEALPVPEQIGDYYWIAGVHKGVYD